MPTIPVPACPPYRRRKRLNLLPALTFGSSGLFGIRRCLRNHFGQTRRMLSFVHRRQALVLLWLVAALQTIGMAVQAQVFNGLRYTAANGTVTIVGYDCGTNKTVQIPSTINGTSVISIGEYAFAQCTSLTTIAIPHSVTSIGHGAFAGCASLNSITVDPANSVYSSVGGVLFDKNKTLLLQCPHGLTGIYTIPNSVRLIVSYAFFGSRLTSITIPESVKSIGNYAFAQCSSLTSISIPNSITTLNGGVFDGCSSLTSISIPNSITTIAGGVFNGCSSLTSITIPNSVKNIKSDAYGDPFGGCTSLTSITIGNNVAEFDYRFTGCTKLNSITVDPANSSYSSDGGVLFNKKKTTLLLCPQGVNGSYTIPNSVTSIRYGAFAQCSSLTRIGIGTSLTSLGGGEFLSCTRLDSITVDPANPKYSSDGGILFDKAKATLLLCPKGFIGIYTIPNSVTAIGNQAFSQCNRLTGITIPNSVTSIGYRAFDQCSSLSSITIPDSVTAIGHQAFSQCSSLSSITIPNSVTSIGHQAFSQCSSLSSITIPNSVTAIGNQAFSQCSSLSSITIPNSVTTIGQQAFSRCSSLTNITVDPANPAYSSQGGVLFDKNKTTLISYSQGLTGGYTIPISVTTIQGTAFIYCSGLTSITIPNSVTTIEAAAFVGCSSLTSLTIPNSVTAISGYAFDGCTSLTNITVDPANPAYSSQGGVLFNRIRTTLLTCPPGFVGAYAIPEGVTSIGVMSPSDSAFNFFGFNNCQRLMSITIPDSVTNISYQAFSNCDRLTSIRIPKTIKTIGGNPPIGEHMANNIASGAFNGCSSLTNIAIPNGVTLISQYAFSVCSNLTSIVIPSSIRAIGVGPSDTDGMDFLYQRFPNLTNIFFRGDAPRLRNLIAMDGSPNTTIYHMPGAAGWESFPVEANVKVLPYPEGTRFPADATAQVVNGYIVGFRIEDSGYGYKAPPHIKVVGGGGSGATATATIDVEGMVSSIKVVNPGSGYSTEPKVEITEATIAPSPERATATATLVNGFVVAINLAKKGYGYTEAPKVAIVGGGGTGAAAICVLDASGSIAAIHIQNPGFGYSSAPTVVIDPPLVAASGNASIVNGFVVGANVVQGGFGYATPPVVRFIGGGGSGATATTTIDANGTVTAINMLNIGSGYTTAPTLLIAPPIVPAPTASASTVQTLVFAGLNNLLRYELQQSTDSGLFQSTGIAVTPENGAFITTSDLLSQGVFSNNVNDTHSFRLVAQPVPTAASASVQVVNGFVVAVNLINGGNGYTVAPTVSIADSTGAEAVVTATVNNGAVIGFTVKSPGHSYSSSAKAIVTPPPTVSIAPLLEPTLRIGVTNLLQNFSYQLQTSTNLPTFGNSGAAFIATNTWQYLYIPMQSAQGFSRIQFVQ